MVFEAQPNGVKDSYSEDAVHAKELRENEMSIDALIEALVDHEFYCVSYSTKDNWGALRTVAQLNLSVSTWKKKKYLLSVWGLALVTFVIEEFW